MVKKSSSNTNKSSAASKVSALNEAELAIINDELGASLRKAAEYFIAEVKRRFDPLSNRADVQSTTEFADKIAHIRRELSQAGDTNSPYSDDRIRKLFYAPSMFAEGQWHTLTHKERLRIISTGLKIVGGLLEQRYRADNSPEYRALLAQKARDESSPHPKNKSVAPKNSISPSHEGVPSHSLSPSSSFPLNNPRPSDVDNRSADAQGMFEETLRPPSPPPPSIEPQPAARMRTPQEPFDQRVLLTPITRVPWREQRISNALENETSVQTLLDLVNLPSRQLSALLGAAKSNLTKFRLSLKDMHDSNGNSCGDALSLIFSPVKELPLSKSAVLQLEKIQVYPSAWCGDSFGSNSLMPPVAIDNGWRLLRHYNPETMTILSAQELALIKKTFQEAGFYSTR